LSPARRVPGTTKRSSTTRSRRPSAAPDAFDRAPLAARRTAIDRHLERMVSPAFESAPKLGAAMRYALLSPGKRLRPLLTLASCEAVGGSWKRAMPAAAAIECVHAFSLVHDDLPAMDDDDFRRGRPTTHRKFGEALGVLAGDALLALAFEELTRLRRNGVAAARVLWCVDCLARASGANELVGGQALDIESEGRKVTTARVAAIDLHKTGALIGASLALGAIAGGMPAGRVPAIEGVGRFLGFAFQMQDDLLNARSSLRRLGKRAGTDRARGKATILSLLSEEQTRAKLALAFDLVRDDVRRRFRRPDPVLRVVNAVADRSR
jgi:geranylgeranyl diphosphate synthase type II